MSDVEFQRRKGVRSQAVLAAIVGVIGFVIGWGMSFERMGWPLGLLLGWWPAAVLGSGAAWTVVVGGPELAALVSRAAQRRKPPADAA